MTQRLAVLLLPAMVSCAGGGRGAAVEIDGRGWRPGKAYELTLYNDDTLSRRDIYLFMLHKSDLADECGVLPLTVTAFAPDSTFHTSYLALHPDPVDLAEWRRSSWIETRTPYLMNATLLQTGYYRFVISSDAVNTVYGVKAVGMEITD